MPKGKPNILILWGDDIGWYNISHNNRGAMGYRTPNIDRIAREGIEFTDYYAQQSCTAGRAAFITGQNPIRTGLTKVGIPGADLGLQPEDPTIAELLGPHGYVTGQFGKNHLGDRNMFLPTVHGFDEFYGNLYHLNAEEEPENPDYPKDPEFRARFGPRGVLHCKATDVDDPTEDPRFGRVGKQTIEDTGPLNTKRMETIDDDVTDCAIELIRKAHAAGTPFFVWWNSTHMHLYTHIPKEAEGISGQGRYNDAMVLHDRGVGRLLDVLDELGIAGDTIVQYSTDNGPHFNAWPDAAITPWRNLTGEVAESPRTWFFYTNDDGQVSAIRIHDWKIVFLEQRAKGMMVWAEPFVPLRMPKIFNLRRDPFERADESSNTYWDWVIRHVPALYAAQALTAAQIQSFEEFPPRQRPASFNLDTVLAKLQSATDGSLH